MQTIIVTTPLAQLMLLNFGGVGETTTQQIIQVSQDIEGAGAQVEYLGVIHSLELSGSCGSGPDSWRRIQYLGCNS